MNRRNFTASALGLLASAFGVANAKPNGDGIASDWPDGDGVVTAGQLKAISVGDDGVTRVFLFHSDKSIPDQKQILAQIKKAADDGLMNHLS